MQGNRLHADGPASSTDALFHVLYFLNVVCTKLFGVIGVGVTQRAAEGGAVNAANHRHAVFFQLGNAAVLIVIDFFTLGHRGMFGRLIKHLFISIIQFVHETWGRDDQRG
jgi:hypothetical protein